MKKILSLAAIALFAGSVNAQTLSFGPSVGFGHSWLRTPDDLAEGTSRDFHPSYNVGAKLVYSFVSHWGVSADLKFSGEGGKFTDNAQSETTYRLNYLRVPIQGIYFFNELGDNIRPKVSLGPSFGFLMGGKGKVEVDGDVQEEQKAKDFAKTFDLGLNAAIGANFKLSGDKWLNADITYAHGFTGVFDNGGSNSDNAKNSGIGINVGILFPINHMKKK
ncbi:MAG: PorT family protein [Chitinophagaceae bacterium]|nr:MAG: PorT family protein [Chitinophagaceae bacterium]